MLEAANASPVGMGKYEEIQLIVIKDKALLDELDKNGANFFNNPDAHPLYGAPVLILVVSKENNIADANAAMIIHNMALAATDIGIGSCDIYGAIAGLNTNPALVKKLSLEDGFKPMAGIVIGQTDETISKRNIPADRIKVKYI